MRTRSSGRGIAATFGLLLVLVAIVGAGVLWVMADRRPGQAIDGFARGPVGCTTTLEFADVGTFYVFEERVSPDSDAFDDCAPSPGGEFGVTVLADGRPLAVREDTSISYDTDGAVGTSLVRIEIDTVGRYDLVVEGPDPAVVGAIGRDPNLGVTQLRRGAIAVGASGLVLGTLLLVLAGRRSKRAATFATPAGPGWSPAHQTVETLPSWPPEPPRLPPLAAPADPSEARPSESPWAPPAASDRRPGPPT